MSTDRFEEKKYNKLIAQRESLHILKRVAQHHYAGISNALSLNDCEEAQKRLNKLMSEFDKTWTKISKLRRKND